MTKEQIVEKVSSDAKISKTQAGKAVSAIIEGITSTLKKGGKVTLVGFGTFKVGRRKARTGKNPKTGEKIKIPAARVPKFSAGSILKKAIK